jgi:hypothetical protein
MPSSSSWGRMTRAGYRNSHPFGQRLRRFLHDNRQFKLLPPDVEWVQGGCLLLAEGLTLWGEGALRSGGTVRFHPRGQPYLDHAFAYSPAVVNSVLIDGDGLADEAAMRDKLEQSFSVSKFDVRYADCADLAVGIYRDAGISAAIAASLTREFGPFNAELLAPL